MSQRLLPLGLEIQISIYLVRILTVGGRASPLFQMRQVFSWLGKSTRSMFIVSDKATTDRVERLHMEAAESHEGSLPCMKSKRRLVATFCRQLLCSSSLCTAVPVPKSRGRRFETTLVFSASSIWMKRFVCRLVNPIAR